MKSETCGNCVHSQELTGLWIKLADEYVRCTVDKVEDCLHLTAKRNECHYRPSKWGQKDSYNSP